MTLDETHASQRPAVVLDARGVLHLVWIDLDRATPVLRHRRFTLDGTPLGGAQTIAREVEPAVAAPAAAALGSRVYVAWSAERDGRFTPMLAALDLNGSMTVRPEALDRASESQTPVALAAAGGRLYAAWSRLRGSATEVVVAPLVRVTDPRPFPHPQSPVPNPIFSAAGDFPALAPSGDGVWLAWWRVQGSGKAAVIAAPIQRDRSGPVAEVTGDALFSGRITPPAIAASGGVLHAVFSLSSGGIVSTTRIFYARAGRSAADAYGPRDLAPQTLFATQPSLASAPDGRLVVLWSDGRARKTRNLEIYEGRFGEGEDGFAQSRVSYTLAGSVQPVAFPRPDGHLSAVWLEVRGPAHYDVVLSTTAGARPRLMVWGLPELDLSRPASALAFVASAALAGAVLALVHTLALLLATGVAYYAIGLVLSGYRWWDRLHRSPEGSLAVALVLYLAIKAAYSGVLLQGSPAGWGLLVGTPSAAGVLVAAAARIRRQPLDADVARLALAVLFVFLDVLLTLTPTAAARLSRL